MSETRIRLQAALNGDRTKARHTAVPVSVEELARDAAACVAAGGSRDPPTPARPRRTRNAGHRDRRRGRRQVSQDHLFAVRRVAGAEVDRIAPLGFSTAILPSSLRGLNLVNDSYRSHPLPPPPTDGSATAPMTSTLAARKPPPRALLSTLVGAS